MPSRPGFRSDERASAPLDSRIESLRVPPHSVEAEQAVIGGLMLAPESLDHVADQIDAEDFYRRDHRLIYEAICGLAAKNKPFDVVTLGEWFDAGGKAEQIGGSAYLIELASTTPSAANIAAYAEIVREKSMLRRLIEAGTEIVNDGFQPGQAAVREILDKAEERVFKIAEQGDRGRKDHVTLREAMKEAFQVLQERYENQGSVTGLPTGFVDLDEMTAGLQPTDLIILAARPSMGKCLSADAEIVLDDGSVTTIETICSRRAGRIGTLGGDLRLARAQPSDFVDDGMKPTFEVTTRLGRRIQTTAPHPFLTLDGWKPLMELQEGDFVAVPRTLPVFGEEALRDCEVRLLAYLIGDGGLTGTVPHFTNTHPDIVADFEDAVRHFGSVVARPVSSRSDRAASWRIVADAAAVTGHRGDFARALDGVMRARALPASQLAAAVDVSPSVVTQWRRGRSAPSAERFRATCRVLGVESSVLAPDGIEAAQRNVPNPLTRWLRQLGLMGGGAHAKHVPDVVHRLPRPQLALFLNRLFATDGWASVLASGQAQLGYASVSERLARQIQHLLLRFGVIAKLRLRWVRYRDARRPSWQLDITGSDSIRRFADEIGIHGRHDALEKVRHALRGRRQQTNVDLIPVQVWSRIDRSRGGMSWAELGRRCGFSASNIHAFRRGLSRGRLARIAMVLQDEQLAALAGSDVVWDRIESIRSTGVQQVYDLTIPGTHNFIANDVCVHNTTLAVNMAEYAALKTKKAVAIFSMEMSASQLAFRLISSMGRVNAQRLRTGQLEDEDWSRVNSAIRMLSEVKIFIDDKPGLTPVELRGRARRLKRDHDLGLIVVDYLQLMQVQGTQENRATEIAEISRSLKGLAKELKVPVVALSQLNRSLESRTDKRPVMSDLRESGGIEQDADLILFIYRDEVYNKDKQENKGLAEVIIAKQRNGPTGKVDLRFFGEFTKFENLARDSYGSFE